ncbi:MbnP family protein [Flavobacterium arundinis]
MIAFASCLTACSSDDSSPVAEGTSGEVELYFDNGVAGDALLLGSSYTNGNGESLAINRLNYIVSNMVLIKADGSEYVYPKEESYFVISAEGNLKSAMLENIPAGDYTKIRLGLGVDKQRYLQGETAQQSFWDLAAGYEMTWTWSTGYKFINFEGTFTSAQYPQEKIFQVHQGSNTSTDNYREITLSLPTTARVRQGELASIHFKVDANAILDGINKIKLGENMNQAGTASSIMGGENLIKIAENTLQMFAVDHVHNGAGSPH